ncbi:MAG: hypothetical protein ACC682_15175 [Gemmatimonadota bacterium]
MNKLRRIAPVMAFAIALGALSACSDTTGPVGGASVVSVGFRTIQAGPAASIGSAVAYNATSRTLALTGSNGTLELDDVRFIVAEFELERVGANDCEDDDGSDGIGGDDDDDGEHGDDGDRSDEDSCEEFKVGPQFVQLPLDGSDTPAITQAVPAGVYDALEFEIEDMELDDDEDAGEVQALFDEIRAVIPDWPEEASMLVSGSFTPTDGTPVAFRVFFKAEIEIEEEFSPPLDLTDSDATVTVIVDPALWFANGDGTVMDLSQYDGMVVEFEAEFENGFSDIDFDHDDHDDDHDDD